MRIAILRAMVVALVCSTLSLASASAFQVGDSPESLLDQAQSTLVSDPAAGLDTAREAVAAERALPTPRQDILLRGAWLEAEALFRLGRLDDAAEGLSKTFAEIDSESTDIYGKLLVASGRIARARGDNGLALRNFQEAFRVFSDIDNRRYMAISLQGLSTLYNNARQYERAIEYDERAARIYPDDPMINVVSLNNRGNALRRLGRFDEARTLFLSAIATDAAQASDAIAQRIYTNLAALELVAGNREASENAVNAVRDIVERNERLSVPLMISAIDAQLSAEAGRVREALRLLDRAFDETDFDNTTEDAREAHSIAYEVYREADRPADALYHLEAFKRLSDIENNVAASANLAILNAEFELSSKELEIATLRSERLESDVALINAKRQQEQLITAAVIALAIGISSFLIWQTLQAGRVRRITERLNRKLEAVNQKLRRSNIELEKASSAKTEFLATTSHEVRTPLNAVINLTAAVLDNTEKGTDAYEKLSTALTSAEHLHEIVSDVLDVARFEGKRVNAHLNDIPLQATLDDVANLWRPKAEEKKLDFLVDIEDVTEEFYTDEKLLRQVLSNLVSNAIKFTHEGTVALFASGGGDRPVTIRVSDSGIGIAEEHRTVIFESFRQVETGGTRSFGGTGLGLAISRQIVELLGGTIAVQSSVGEGTSFTVTLPLLERREAVHDEPAPANLPPEEIDKTLKDLRVLAAEDNAVNAMVIQAILKSKVGTLTIVENGAEAVNAMYEDDFDVILMDKQMPIMDGVEATRRIRAMGGHAGQTPIIAVTADAFDAARNELLKAGADDYLSKPIKPDDLKQAIAAVLGSRETPLSPGRRMRG